jgi:hypothetical protein
VLSRLYGSTPLLRVISVAVAAQYNAAESWWRTLSFALRFRDYGILGLDIRTNHTEEVVMSDQHWSNVKVCLGQASGSVRTLLVLSAVPVVYRDFRTTESVIDITPWQEELTDDIRDRWRSWYHEGERMKLIMNLFAFQARSPSEPIKRVILAGDVHVGCLGVIRDRRNADHQRLIHGKSCLKSCACAAEYQRNCLSSGFYEWRDPCGTVGVCLAVTRERSVCAEHRDSKALHGRGEPQRSPLPHT